MKRVDHGNGSHDTERTGRALRRTALLASCLFLGALHACNIDDRDPGADTLGLEPDGTGGRSQDAAVGDGGSTTVASGNGGTEGGNVDLPLDGSGGSQDCDDCPDVLGECSVGSVECATATSSMECGADGRWGAAVPCDYVCSAGVCGGECVPDNTQCTSETRVRTCSSTGSWGEPADCEFACVNDACGGVCKPGATQCEGSTQVRTCSVLGEWGEPTPCENACVGTACAGECEPDATQCYSNTQVQTCNDLGQWLEPEACPLACVGTACGGDCQPNARRCDTSSGLPQLCSAAGVWENQAACPFVCQGSGTCGGACVPTSRRCNPETGLPQLCSAAGAWTNQAACDFVCTGNGVCTGECVPTRRRCDPNTGLPQLCNATGTWTDQPACEFVCTGNGACTGECDPTDRQCEPGTRTPQLCSAQGAWVDQPTCQFVCSDGFCTGECTPTSRRCEPGTGLPQLCSSAGEWDSQTACGANRTCSGQGQCLCNAGFATCGNTCADLDTNAQHCGACNHSCLGGTCVDGRCQPVDLAVSVQFATSLSLSANHVYFGDRSTRTLKRVPKNGGAVETIVAADTGAGLRRLEFVAVGPDNRVYWTWNTQAAPSFGSVFSATLTGTGQSSFTPPDETAPAHLAVSGTNAYYIRDGINFFRAPLTNGRAPVAMPRFDTAGGAVQNVSLVNNCFFYTTSATPTLLMRNCVGSTGQHYRGLTSLVFGRESTDGTFLYFFEGNGDSRRLQRISFGGGGAEALGAAAPQAGVPTADESSVYYFQRGNVGAPACTDTYTLFRVAKTGLSNPVELVPPPQNCPTPVVVDNQAIYWANTETGTIRKVAK